MHETKTNDLQLAFRMSAELIQHESYHEMTHLFLTMLNQLEGVQDAISYEVFGDAAKRSGEVSQPHEFLVRRFPLSLGDQSDDENFKHIEQVLDSSIGGVHQLKDEGGTWTVLDVCEKVKPRRIILIFGELSEFSYAVVSGLYGVYANQVALLDKKERDQLTHLPNRHSFDLTFSQVLEFYRRQQDKLQSSADPLQTIEEMEGYGDKASWLAVVDVDRFKSINDELGHLYGDEVLLSFASLIEKTFRYSDFLFRFGGDEFVIVINQTDLDGARLCLERFRKRVEEFDFAAATVSTSIGFAKIDPSKPSSRLLEEADKALYRAKELGRNNVQFYDASADSGQCSVGDVELF